MSIYFLKIKVSFTHRQNKGDKLPGRVVMGNQISPRKIPNLAKLCHSIYLRNGEQSNPGHKDQSHGVKPAANVGKDPQGEAELDGVNHAFDQEKTSELNEAGIQFGRRIVGKRINFVFGNRYADV